MPYGPLDAIRAPTLHEIPEGPESVGDKTGSFGRAKARPPPLDIESERGGKDIQPFGSLGGPESSDRNVDVGGGSSSGAPTGVPPTGSGGGGGESIFGQGYGQRGADTAALGGQQSGVSGFSEGQFQGRDKVPDQNVLSMSERGASGTATTSGIGTTSALDTKESAVRQGGAGVDEPADVVGVAKELPASSGQQKQANEGDVGGLSRSGAMQLPLTDQASKAADVNYGRALYDFTSRDESNLKFKRGDVVRVLKKG